MKKALLFIVPLVLFVFANVGKMAIDANLSNGQQNRTASHKEEVLVENSKIQIRIKWAWDRLGKEFNEDDVKKKARIEVRNDFKNIWTDSFEFDDKIQTVEHFAISDGKLQGAALKYDINEEDPDIFAKSLFDDMEEFFSKQGIKTQHVFNDDHTGNFSAEENSKKCVLIWNDRILMVNIFTVEVFQQ